MRLRAALVALLIAFTSVGIAAASSADVSKRAPSTTWVKKLMKGFGSWEKGTFPTPDNIAGGGTEPASCGLANFVGTYRSARSVSYLGQVKKAGVNYYAQAAVTTYRYSSAAKAKRALKALSTYAATCSQTVEWVCQDCDGIWEVSRDPAARRLGVRSTAWRSTSVGMGLTSSRTIAVRSGRAIALIEVSHQGDPLSTAKPPYPTWKQAERLARRMLT